MGVVAGQLNALIYQIASLGQFAYADIQQIDLEVQQLGQRVVQQLGYLQEVITERLYDMLDAISTALDILPSAATSLVTTSVKVVKR